MKIGILGCGHWGRNYIRVLHELPVDLVELCDLDTSRCEEIAGRYPAARITRDPVEIVKSPTLDAVVISTPATTHFDLALTALNEGKHVLVEKPMTLCPEEAEELVEAAARRSRILMVGHTFLYNDAVTRMKEIVRAPASGAVYYLTAQRNHLGLIRGDVGVLWDLVPHDVSIFSYLMDAWPLWVSAVDGQFLRPGVGDAVFVTLGFPDSVVGHVEASWVDAHKVRQVVAVTSHRRVVFDDLNLMESVRIYEKGVTSQRPVDSFGEFQYLLRDGDIVSPRIAQREPLRNLCAHFVECIETGRRPLTDGEIGLRVVRVLAAAEQSMRNRGAAVDLS